MADRVDYKIFKASYSGGPTQDSFVGGSPSNDIADSILPKGSIEAPADGDGDRWIYQKYFIAITNTNFTEAPTISNIDVSNISHTGAHVTFDTDVSGSTIIQYGTVPQTYTDQYVSTELVLSHTAQVTGLDDGTKYYFKVESDNSAGVRGSSDENSFVTLDVTPPVLSNVSVNLPVVSQPRAIWDSNEATTGSVAYGRTTDYSEGTGHSSSFGFSHTVQFDVVNSGDWLFEITARDLAGNETTTGNIPLFVPSTGGGDDPPPSLSSQNVQITGAFYARVVWDTDRPATSVVRVGTGSQDYYTEVGDQSLKTRHNVAITPLADEVNYYYQPISVDAAGLTGTGAEGNFLTIDGTAPSITGVSVINSSPTAATIKFGVDQVSVPTFTYGTGLNQFDEPDGGFIVNQASGMNFSAVNFSLTPGTEYYGNIVVVDENNITGQYKNWTWQMSGAADTTAPTFSNIIAIPTHGQDIFTWATNEDATSRVNYSIFSGLKENVATGNTFETNHIVRVEGLSSGTTYWYNVEGYDQAGNTGESAWAHFQTLSGQVAETVQIYNVAATNATHNAASISWNTNLSADSLVSYGTGTPTEFSEFDGTFTTDHTVGLTGLQSDTTYYYTCTSVNENDVSDSVTSSDFSFTTESAPGTSDLSAGDALGIIEIEVPPGNFFQGKLPIHTSVHLVNENDLNINWKVIGPAATDIVVQRELVQRNAAGQWNRAEVIAIVNIPATAVAGDKLQYTLVATDDPTPGDWGVPDFELEMRMSMPGGNASNDHVADVMLNTNNPVTYKDGHLCKSYRYYTRLEDRFGKKTLGVHAYVTYYRGYPVRIVRLQMSNCHVDPAKPTAGQGEHGHPFDVVGAIYFDELWVELKNDPQFKLQNRCTRFHASQPSDRRLNFVEYGSGGDASNRSVQGVRSELWPGGFSRHEHIAITDIASDHTILAQSMLEYLNYGHIISGRNGTEENRSIGPALLRKGKLDDEFAVPGVARDPLFNDGGSTFYGRDGLAYLNRRTADIDKYRKETNTILYAGDMLVTPDGDNISSEQCGCWHFGMYLGNKGTTGGKMLLSPTSDLDCTAAALKYYSYYMDTTAERGNEKLLFLPNGNPCGAHDFKTLHGTIPFAARWSTNPKDRVMFLLWGDIRNDGEIANGNWTNIEYFYNSGTCDYIDDDSITAGGHWDDAIPMASTHSQRLWYPRQILVQEFNCPMSREQLRCIAEWGMMCNDKDVNYDSVYGNTFEGSIAAWQQRLTADPANWYKGLSHVSSNFGRNKAWSNYCYGMAYIFALDQDGPHGSKVHAKDEYNDGTKVRSYTYDQIVAWYDLMEKAVPGGPTAKTPAEARFLMADNLASGLQCCFNEVLGGVRWGVRNVGIGLDTFQDTLKAAGYYDVVVNHRYVAEGATSGARHGIIWWEFFGDAPVSGQDGEVIIDKVGTIHNDYINGEFITIKDTFNGDAQVGLFIIMAGNIDPIHAQSPLRSAIGMDDSWTYPIDQTTSFGWGQIMEMNFHAFVWYAMGKAAFDNVDNAKRDVLYNYCYEYCQSQLEAADDPINPLWQFDGTHGGYRKMMAVSHYGSANKNTSTYNIPDRVNMFTRWEDLPPTSPWHKSITTSTLNEFTFFPTVCALYAADELGYYSAPTSLTQPLILEPVRFNILWQDPNSNPDLDKKIKDLYNISNQSNKNAWYILPYMSSWAGEIRYRQSQVGASTSDTKRVKNVRVGIRNQRGPGAVYFAASNDQNSIIEGFRSTTDGDQSDVKFYDDVNIINTGDEGEHEFQLGTEVPSPEFRTAKGGDAFITLYGSDGKLGGEIIVDDSNRYAVPIWIAIQLKQNEDPGTLNIDFGLEADEG